MTRYCAEIVTSIATEASKCLSVGLCSYEQRICEALEVLGLKTNYLLLE